MGSEIGKFEVEDIWYVFESVANAWLIRDLFVIYLRPICDLSMTHLQPNQCQFNPWTSDATFGNPGADGQHGLIEWKPEAVSLFRATFWNIWA